MTKEIAVPDPSSGEVEVARQGQISAPAQAIRGAFRLGGFVAGTAWNAVGTTVDVSRQLVEAAMEGESSADIAERAAVRFRTLARNTLGVTEESVREIVSYVPSGIAGPQSAPHTRSRTPEELRQRGDALLAASADVYVSDEVHPAFDRILDELAPDEARILRFFSLNGAQPAVDVRTNRPLGIGSELVGGDLSSVAEQAGCRHTDRSRLYVINLKRLGLVAVSPDPVELSRYMVLEVQPIVEQSIKKAGRSPKIVRKSLRLTDFGEEFCRTCFSLDADADRYR